MAQWARGNSAELTGPPAGPGRAGCRKEEGTRAGPAEQAERVEKGKGGAGQGKKQWAFGPKMRERVFLLFLIPFLFLVFQSKFKCKPNANSNRV